MDIKSPNILLTGVGTAKLTDVGLSKNRGVGTFLSDLPLVGTFAW
jgi:serine/threonine protein kinase